ncbi:4Fe-4S dicluster domain-containing protein [Parasutterella sp.]|uniref:4Fe-4S dicluster domain-containing protein n=1 Tax=Parasutterella sp. TaxID=2049037 RepID=UPI0035204D5D
MLVRNDPDKCVGCNYCIASCPYDARWSHPITGLPMKCISPGCMEMIKEGKQPACVQACPAEARLFGDILDPQSEISQKIASSRTELLMPNKGTKPNFFVVVSK